MTRSLLVPSSPVLLVQGREHCDYQTIPSIWHFLCYALKRTVLKVGDSVTEIGENQSQKVNHSTHITSPTTTTRSQS